MGRFRALAENAGRLMFVGLNLDVMMNRGRKDLGDNLFRSIILTSLLALTSKAGIGRAGRSTRPKFGQRPTIQARHFLGGCRIHFLTCRKQTETSLGRLV